MCFMLQIYDEDERKTARNDEAMHMGVCAEEREREAEKVARVGWRL